MRVSQWAFAGLAVAGAAAAEVQVSVDTVAPGFGEPMVAVAPDGSVYVAALQGFFRSDNNGASWTAINTPLNPAILASDSSIAIDPSGHVYLTFDYPYAGSTASCTSTDKGASWLCNPAFMPGGTDRMWNVAPAANEYYVTTNQGLYQTVMGYSNNGGLAFTSYRAANEVLESYTGTLVKMSSGNLLQASDQGDQRGIISWVEPQGPTSQYPMAILAPFAASGLKRSIGLQSLVRTPDNTIYLAGILPDAAGNNAVQIARSTDEGGHWTLMTIPGTTGGSAVFPWLAAAGNGHIGVVFYSTAARSAGGAPTPNAVWDVTWAETFDAGTAAPHWQLTKVSAGVHTGTVCTGLNCETDPGSTPNARFASDFISSAFAPDGAAHLAWVADDTQAITIRHARVVSTHAPFVTLTASPASVEANQPITLTWTAGGAKSCTASGSWRGAKAIAGGSETLDSGASSGARNYALTCANDIGTTTASAQVVVIAMPPPPPPPGAPSVMLAATPGTVNANENVQLQWAVGDATSCTASGGWSGSKAASGGSESVNVGAGAGDRAYTLACSNAAQTTTRTAHVTVEEPQAPPQSGSAAGGGGGGTLSCGNLLFLALAAWRRRRPEQAR